VSAYGGADISSQIRPGKKWFVVAGAIAVIGIVAGVAAFVFGLVTVTRSVGNFEASSLNGQSVSRHLEPGTYAFFVDENDSRAADCALTEPNRVHTRPPNYTLTFTRNGRSWSYRGDVTVNDAGDYAMSCNGPAFAVGKAPNGAKFAGGLAGALGGLFGLPCLGIMIGAIIALVVGLRRGASRKALLAAQRGYGYPR
jgi:hypothetical protein